MLQILDVQLLFGLRGPPCTDDPNEIVSAFRPYDQHQSTLDRPNRLESVFHVAMSDVIDLQNGRIGSESSRASSNETPCTLAFRAAFSGSHSKRTSFCKLLA